MIILYVLALLFGFGAIAGLVLGKRGMTLACILIACVLGAVWVWVA